MINLAKKGGRQLDIKLIAIDIDETLVNDHQKILPSTLSALKNVINHNVKVVLCTGRPLCGFQNYLHQLGLNNDHDQFVICYNGALVESTASNIISHDLLTMNDFFDLEAFARQNDARCWLCAPNCMYTSSQDISPVAIKESYKVHIPLKYRSLDDIARHHDQISVVKGMILEPKSKLDQLTATLPPSLSHRFTILRSEPDYLEFINPAASKEAGLQSLIQHLDITPANVMAIGNGLNDRGMIQFAGCGVAVANAESAVKQVANYVTHHDYNHNAVAEAVHLIDSF